MSNGHTNGNKVNGFVSGHPVGMPNLPALTLVSPPAPLSSSQQTLLFEQTNGGTPSFRVFAISQPAADLPLTVTTDAPEHFQLAADGSPRFLPKITLTPVASTTYIHVRYLTAEIGPHTGQLTISNGQETISVALTGRRRKRGMVGAFRPLATGPLSGRSGPVRMLKPGLLLAITIVAVMAYVVFTSQSMSPNPPIAGKPADPISVSAPKVDRIVSVKPVTSPPNKKRAARYIRKPRIKTLDAVKQNDPVALSAEQYQPTRQENPSGQVATAVRGVVAQPKKPARSRNSEQAKKNGSSSPSPAAESELERVLNRPQ